MGTTRQYAYHSFKLDAHTFELSINRAGTGSCSLVPDNHKPHSRLDAHDEALDKYRTRIRLSDSTTKLLWQHWNLLLTDPDSGAYSKSRSHLNAILIAELKPLLRAVFSSHLQQHHGVRKQS